MDNYVTLIHRFVVSIINVWLSPKHTVYNFGHLYTCREHKIYLKIRASKLLYYHCLQTQVWDIFLYFGGGDDLTFIRCAQTLKFSVTKSHKIRFVDLK